MGSKVIERRCHHAAGDGETAQGKHVGVEVGGDGEEETNVAAEIGQRDECTSLFRHEGVKPFVSFEGRRRCIVRWYD